MVEAWSALDAGDVDRAIGVANRGLADLAVEPGEELLGWLRLVLGHAARARGDLQGAAGQLTAAFEEFESSGDDRGLGRTLRAIGLVALGGGKVDESTSPLGEAVRALDRVDDPDLELALLDVARLARELGDVETADQLVAGVEQGADRPRLVRLALARCGLA